MTTNLYKRSRLLALFVFCAMAVVAYCQPCAVVYYDRHAYGGGTQNWAVGCDRGRGIYCANADGLLYFNGNDWDCLRLPGEQTLRCVKVVERRIYVGGDNVIGYYEREPNGRFVFTSLMPLLKPVEHGATTIWERWNGYESAFGQGDGNNMNSMNHFALGSVGQWMYEYQLGIAPGQDQDGVWGYKNFVLQPECGGTYTSLKGSFDSNYGNIVSTWKADGHGFMTEYSCTLPANTSCTLYLPTAKEVYIEVSGNGATFVGDTIHNGHAVKEFYLLSGDYTFSINR